MKLEAHIHLGSDMYCPPGQIHIVCAPRDYAAMKDFLTQHFEVWESIRDENGWPTGRIYRVHKEGDGVG